jgi:hypothetical protein
MAVVTANDTIVAIEEAINISTSEKPLPLESVWIGFIVAGSNWYQSKWNESDSVPTIGPKV